MQCCYCHYVNMIRWVRRNCVSSVFCPLYRVLMATVHVLPEVTLPSHPEGSLLSCYHKFGCQATTHGQLDKISTGKNRLGKTKCKRVKFWLWLFLNRLPRFLFTAKRHQMQVMQVLTKMTEKLKLTFMHSLYPNYGSRRVFIKNWSSCRIL